MNLKPRHLLVALAVSMTLSLSPVSAGENVKVLIIDSGSDFTHNALKPLAFANQAELTGKSGVDDDNNGYADDVYGWNFVENSNTLVNLKDTPPKYDEVLRCMELLGKLQAFGQEGMDPAEYKYLVDHYKDKPFWAWVEFSGGWAHGTHCAGITSTKNSNVSLNAIKHIQTGNGPKEEAAEALTMVKHNMAHRRTRTEAAADTADTAVKKVPLAELEKYFVQAGQQYAAQIQPKAEYIGKLQPRVINCSFGSPNSAIIGMIKQNMVESWGWTDPTDAEVQEVANAFVNSAFLPRDKALFSKVTNALIVIASGNSSEDLDLFVSSPNDVPISNKLVIAATDEDQKLAPFSCYGKEKVDVAVPGVNIFSSYPNQKMGYMSGTSMACPLAVNYAAQVFFVNPDLTPVQVKKILMDTVDKKTWLTDKVKSGGVINVTRAMQAASLIKDGKTIAVAIKTARKTVADKVSRSAKRTRPNLNDPMVKELYFSVIK
ncbi:MAG: S8 family serine peptidase [Candidatus Riflebacteria bacterium]|nr:S8 family serine peptidase [Candidatus Riflebacteria bacterium]